MSAIKQIINGMVFFIPYDVLEDPDFWIYKDYRLVGFAIGINMVWIVPVIATLMF